MSRFRHTVRVEHYTSFSVDSGAVKVCTRYWWKSIRLLPEHRFR